MKTLLSFVKNSWIYKQTREDYIEAKHEADIVELIAFSKRKDEITSSSFMMSKALQK